MSITRRELIKDCCRWSQIRRSVATTTGINAKMILNHDVDVNEAALHSGISCMKKDLIMK